MISKNVCDYPRNSRHRVTFVFVIIAYTLPAYVFPINGAIAATNLQESSQQTSQETAQNTQTARAQLRDILTSEQYAESIEKEEWAPIPKEVVREPKEQSWLSKFLEDLFDIDFDADTGFSLIEFLSILLKTVFIGALIALIFWIIARATGLQGWRGKLSTKTRRLSSVSEYEALRLSQGWQSLPPHDQIPSSVNKLIEAQDYNQAASILYRGGLRWLAKSHSVYIVPATTEMQCVKQMNKLNQSNMSLSATTKDYMTSVIFAWIEVAYNSDSSTSSNSSATIANTLQQLNDTWLTHLPLSIISDKSTDSRQASTGFNRGVS